MKMLIILVLTVVVCSSCAALPAEERAFVVALCVEKDDVWRIYGRIPTYQSGGGYTTVSGQGETMAAALADMDAAAPMRINLSQLRLLAAEVRIARSGELVSMLEALANRPDMRMECAVALTNAPAKSVADALDPAAGTRLSKALELMLDARAEQGVILPALLSGVLRMGERQSAVLIALSLEGKKIALAGGYTMEGLHLGKEDVALLSLLLNHAKSLQLLLPDGYADVRDADAKVRLSDDLSSARVELTMTATASAYTEMTLEQTLADRLLVLLTRLSSAGCDALGLGRQAVMHARDMPAWHALRWPEVYRKIRWEVGVGVEFPV